MAEVTSFKFRTRLSSEQFASGSGGGGGGSSTPSNFAYTNVDNSFSAAQTFNADVTIGAALGWTGVATGNGSGITDLNASNLASGTINDARLSSNVALKDTDNNFSVSQTFGANLTVTGDLIVNGTQFISNTETVEIEDNLLVINNGEVGAGVTSVLAGIEVDRGSLTNYQFLFDEATDLFKIGTAGDLQAVATRPDSPTNGYYARWSTSSNSLEFVDDSSIDAGSVNGLGALQIGEFDLTSFTTTGQVAQWDNVDQRFEPLSLASIATSGDYNDLINKPTINNWTISDGSNTELVGSQTIVFSGQGIASTSYDGVSNTLTISATETDPIFSASASSGISSGDISNWNTAFGWGDWSTGVTKIFVDALGINASSIGGFGSSRLVILDDSPVPSFALNDVVAYTDTVNGYFGKLTLATVATSGSYNDLSDKPSSFYSFDVSGDSGTGTIDNSETLTISGLGLVSTSFNALSNTMTISATFSESDTLQTVTDRGATTTQAITTGGLTSNGNATINNTLSKIVLNNTTTGLSVLEFQNYGTKIGEFMMGTDTNDFRFVNVINDNNADMDFRVRNNNVRLKIKGSGEVLVGKTSVVSGYTFQVAGSSIFSGDILTEGSATIDGNLSFTGGVRRIENATSDLQIRSVQLFLQNESGTSTRASLTGSQFNVNVNTTINGTLNVTGITTLASSSTMGGSTIFTQAAFDAQTAGFLEEVDLANYAELNNSPDSTQTWSNSEQIYESTAPIRFNDSTELRFGTTTADRSTIKYNATTDETYWDFVGTTSHDLVLRDNTTARFTFDISAGKLTLTDLVATDIVASTINTKNISDIAFVNETNDFTVNQTISANLIFSGASRTITGLASLTASGNIETTGGSIKTGAPSGGTSRAWKLGDNITTGTSYVDIGYVEVEINGSAVQLCRRTDVAPI